jgi:hypothetical protein
MWHVSVGCGTGALTQHRAACDNAPPNIRACLGVSIGVPLVQKTLACAAVFGLVQDTLRMLCCTVSATTHLLQCDHHVRCPLLDACLNVQHDKGLWQVLQVVLQGSAHSALPSTRSSGACRCHHTHLSAQYNTGQIVCIQGLVV